jgi:hypothetical protein
VYIQNSSYSVDVVSQLPEFKNKALKKYAVEGIETIGVWGNEPFEIKFKNNTYERVQIKVSIDGTDILTGDVADTTVIKQMWVVEPLGTITLKAWPETQNGGAEFIFTHAGNSVAAHTHGDMSSRGIIAVAVFREGYKEPTRIVNHNYWGWGYPYYDSWTLGGNQIYGGGGTFSSSGTILTSNCVNSSTAAMDSMNATVADNESLFESAAGVGAGQHVEQKITYTTGLKEPYFAETIRVKYLWWDDLLAKLKETHSAVSHASGFPGDQQELMSIGSTPRIGEYKKVAFPKTQTQPSYARI